MEQKAPVTGMVGWANSVRSTIVMLSQLKKVVAAVLVAAYLTSCGGPNPSAPIEKPADNSTSELSRTEKLKHVVQSADRVRVRSGGTCHRRIENEKTLFELSGAEAVTKFASWIEVDDDASGFECMCCGSPTFEFYKGETLVASVGFHHGQSLRWLDGWEGDSALTPTSSAKLCRLLKEHGVSEPLEELEEHARRAAAAERRFQLYVRLLPGDIQGALANAHSESEAADAFSTRVQGTDAVRLYFRILGCALSGWDGVDQLENMIMEDLLPSATPSDVSSAISGLHDDAQGTRGAARWILWCSKWNGLDPKALEQVLPDLAAAALAHPDSETRRRLLWTLWQIGNEPAREAMSRFVRGEIPACIATEDERQQPGGMRVYRSQSDDVEADADATCAVVYLSRLGHKEILPAAKELLKLASERDRPLLEEAIRQLGGE